MTFQNDQKSELHNVSVELGLCSIPHFALYPQLLPWVGQFYLTCPLRVLVLGESHYLKPESTYHLDSEAWYKGVDLSSATDVGHFKTRGIIKNGIAKQWAGKSKLIYRNIAAAIVASGLVHCDSPFQYISYMNYFQRPAQASGDSLAPSAQDKLHSARVVSSVIEILQPELVICCSSLAWGAAKEMGLIGNSVSLKTVFVRSVHPATRWWNTKMKKHKELTGTQLFVHGIKNRLNNLINRDVPVWAELEATE
ncbi:hypothetical protein [Vogesella sp. LIG4]|uniref:hypothetical protein n=1 Tax=Vogesella sp. LIG4 TaxID=1192162 RepID=UPI00081FEF75|nr:hypothetical protein [Vogesella sp. LIG4]SCK24273.1 hypothetical protein PSELUDRAFT_2852 [Vogesella sp. LIG4]